MTMFFDVFKVVNLNEFDVLELLVLLLFNVIFIFIVFVMMKSDLARIAVRRTVLLRSISGCVTPSRLVLLSSYIGVLVRARCSKPASFRRDSAARCTPEPAPMTVRIRDV